jgi:hypothetical protein
VRAAKISKTTPCKVAGGGRHSTKQLDTSGKSAAFFDYSEILYAAPRPATAGASVAIAAEKSSPRTEIAGITAANDRLRVAEPRACRARA